MRCFDFYEVETPPDTTPVLLAEAQNWCRDLDSADDALVTSLISAATDQIESMTNRVLVKRTYTGKFSNLSCSKFEPHYYVEIRKAPLFSVTSVKVNGTTLDAADYVIKMKHGFSRILFLNSHSLDSELAYPIEVEFIAGYDSPPKAIVTAIEQLILFWYENRGDVDTDNSKSIPLVVKAIVKQYRIVASYG